MKQQREDNMPLVTIFTYQERQLKLKQQANEQPEKAVTPDPDYDTSPLSSLDHADNHLIDKSKTQPDQITVRKSSEPQSKSTSSVAIKIGEYTDRKEPCKLHFISKFANECNGDVTSQLKSELEKTLSKLNIQNKKEKSENGEGLKDQERSTSNVEKLSAQFITQNPSNGKTEAQKSGNKSGLKKSESAPLNGILKAGSSACSEHKNISFGKTTTTVVDDET